MTRTVSFLAIATWIAVAAVQPAAAQFGRPAIPKASRPTIVFMTDFGTANDSVAICKAVMLGIAQDARILDITHQVTHYQIEEGARFLAAVTPYYPAGTVFIVVVDPGVGTSRKALIVKSKRGQFFVLPDNGLVAPVIERDGLEGARQITNREWMLESEISSTFHGRDIFAPTAAYLANGRNYEGAGPEVKELVKLPMKKIAVTASGIQGEIIGLDDPYGSLISDIPADEFFKLGYKLGDEVSLRINNKPVTLPFGKTFMSVPVGDTLLYIDSRGRVGLAVNQGNYSEKFNVRPPASILIYRKSGAR